jgi:D-alanyl-D-alanine carboxypeptidase
MKILSLDISSKSGWAIHNGDQLIDYGLIRVEIKDFNVNKDVNKSPEYPYNLLDAANEMGQRLLDIVLKTQPDKIVIENTVKGRNRHTQRLLEWMHKEITENLRSKNIKFYYLDPSEWRSILEIKLSNEDKKNNKLVKSGKKRGKITKKHLSVRAANDLYSLNLKIKDNDIADAICLGRAFYERQ